MKSGDDQQMTVTKRLRQGTGEQNKMRSSNYEKMKKTAESN
jgi:hypothetical protein